MWIRKSLIKTNNMGNIPLMRVPRKLLEKYSSDKSCQLRKQVLPVPTNQKINLYLKEIATICNINNRLSKYCSRHTFTISVTIANKGTMENVAHLSTQMIQHYPRALSSKILEDMISVDNKLFNNNLNI